MEVLELRMNAASPPVTETAFGITSIAACFAAGEAFSLHPIINETRTKNAAKLRVNFMTWF